MAVRNIKFTVLYDGSRYHGWQVQPGLDTIQQQLKRVAADLFGFEVDITGASRTDAGVSALGQSVLMQIDSPIPTENIAKAINHRLPDDIFICDVEEVPEGFDVIGDVTSKMYRYSIYTGRIRPVLEITHCWHLPVELDIESMNREAEVLIGQHDFKSFASAADERTNSVRTIFRCNVASQGDWVYIETEGDGFLYNMVRNIVGSLVEVGLRRWEAGKMKEVLEAKDRRAAGPIAPAGGLCLMWIKY